jgi:hypothetical protein
VQGLRDPKEDSQPMFLDWKTSVPLGERGEVGAGQSGGFAIGAALLLSLLSGSTAAVILRNWGWVGWTLAALSAGYAVVQWLRQRRDVRRSEQGIGLTWEVRFGVHDLGAEAVVKTPPQSIAVLLLQALRSRADPPPKIPFLTGLSRGVSSSWRAADAMDEPGLGVEVRWENVTAVRSDPREQIIDLSARGTPGLRLFCTVENFAEVRRFVRRRLPMRFWDDLDE